MSNAGREAVALVERAGLVLDPWQVFCLEAMLGERADGRWAAFEAAVIVARQNGKGAILEARELAGLFLFGEQLIIHSAHEAKTAKQAFARMERLIKRTPELYRRIWRGERGFKRSNEEVSITLKTGAVLRYLTRSEGAARGFTGDLVVLDEAMVLPAAVMGAILPTLSAVPNPQVIYTGSAGFASSTMLHALRRRALAGSDGGLAYCEWSAELPRLVDGRVESDPVVDSDGAVALANPALGFRLQMDVVNLERRAFAPFPQEFARERLGVFDPEPEARGVAEALIPAGLWASRSCPPIPDPDRVAIGWGVDPAGGSASVAIAASRSDGSAYVEVVDHRPGSLWVPGRLVELAKRWHVAGVGWNNGGPSGSLVPELGRQWRQAGFDEGLLHDLGGVRWQQACGSLVTALVGGVDDAGVALPGVWHPAGQGPLDLAVAAGVARRSGDRWSWELQASVPVSPLEAVTAAHAVLLDVGVLDPLSQVF